MWRYVFLVILSVNLCAGERDQEVARKKFYEPFHLLYGGGILYYLTFLAIKIKVIFVIGTIVAIALFAGKAFAIFKYTSLFKDYRNNDAGPYYSGGHEDVVVDYPPPGYGDHYEHHPPVHEHYPSAHEDYPPVHDHHEHIEYRKSSKAYRPINSNYYQNYGTGTSYSSYARSIGNVLSDNVNIVKDVVKRMDLTEYTFNSMNITTDSCKKLFVCEADFRAKTSSLLALGLYVFGDAGFAKYRTEPTVTSITDCRIMYPDCVKSFR